MKIETKYNLARKIWINEIERPGTIKEILIDSFGVQYSVRYFNDGVAKTVYFFENELRDKK